MATSELPQLNQLREVTSTGKVIGKGAYGRVVEVYVHGTLCAAKEVHPILLEGVTAEESDAIKQSFLTECAYTSRLHHPNVVQVLGVYYPTPKAMLPWLVMEMMDTSLKEFLGKHDQDKVPLNIKLSILVDISQGLEFLHGQGIIHRDLSSNNVLMTKHLVAKVADLGVAKIIDNNRMKTQTQTPGTLHFMPPEALSSKPRYGKPVDVFSIGCVTLHVVSHEWPEPKDRVQEIDDSLIALTEVQRREKYLELCTNSSLKQLVKSCIHNKPEQRPEISYVCQELKRIKALVDQQDSLAAGSTIEVIDAVQKGTLQIKQLSQKSKDTEKALEQALREKEEKDKQILELEKKIKDLSAVKHKVQVCNYLLC